MTHSDDEYGEFLRRVLHAEADAVRPESDGLDRIRGRINARQERSRTAFVRGVPARLREALSQLGDPRAMRAWFSAGGWLGEAWARSVVAVGAALIAVGLVVSAPQTLQRITSAGHNDTPGAPKGGGNTSVTEGSQSGAEIPALPPAEEPIPSAPGVPVPETSSPRPDQTDCPGDVRATPLPARTPQSQPSPCPPVSTPTPTPPTTPAPPEPTPTPPTPEPAPEASGTAGAATQNAPSS